MNIADDLVNAFDAGYEKGRAEAELYLLHCGAEMPETNGDRIRYMTDEKLADRIAQILTYHTRASSNSHKDECNINCPLYKCCNDQPYDNIEDWLKSPWEVQE